MKKEKGKFFILGIEKKRKKNKISDFAFKHTIAVFFFFTSISIIDYDSRFYFS